MVFIKALTGKQEYEPRWIECMNLVSTRLPIATGALYVRKYFKQNSKDILLDMIELIKKEFGEILKNASWMDEKTKAAAIMKLNKMMINVGYPNELMDDKKIIEIYKSLKIDENKFFESVLNTKIHYENWISEELFKPFNKSDWRHLSSAATVNAFHGWNRNLIGKIINGIQKFLNLKIVNLCL